MLSARFAVASYGGFFVADLGIVMLATLGLFPADAAQRLHALKGVLSLLVGVISSAAFVCLTPVAWDLVAVLALIGLVGGRWGTGRPPSSVSGTASVSGITVIGGYLGRGRRRGSGGEQACCLRQICPRGKILSSRVSAL